MEKIPSNDLFDFGFTAVDESELEVAKAAEELTDAVHSAEHKLAKLYAAVKPLLANLKKNPDKDYIKWPNRSKKVEEFEALIEKIVKS
jgi:hypothetical protein